MAVTVTFTLNEGGDQRVGRQRVKRGRLALAGTYDTGGFAVAASTFDLARLDSLEISGVGGKTTNGLGAWFDAANLKIKLVEGGATANDNPFDELDNTSAVVDGYVLDVAAYGA